MKINILASSGFHVLDLARELQNLGHDVRFYSYVPLFMTRKAGLKVKNTRSIFLLIIPFLVLEKLWPRKRLEIIMMRNKFMDNLFCTFMRKSDVMICLGSVYLKVLDRAKKDDTISILEWGSKHIIEQRKCFNLPDSYNPKGLERELLSYEKADYIAIPSQHVAKTFLAHGFSNRKLIINPYGVNLNMFPPTELDKQEQYDIIYVGGWRYEKGSDLLVELCEKYDYTVLHVGALVNMPFPKRLNMMHVDPVSPSELTNYYKKAKVFVLPSRAEGLSLVQVQAIASGLPVVCTKETGGSDLQKLLDDPKWLIEMETINADELKKCIDQALRLSENQLGMRKYTSLERYTWSKYGERYSKNLLTICK